MQSMRSAFIAAMGAMVLLAGCQAENIELGVAPDAPPVVGPYRPYKVAETKVKAGTCEVKISTIWQDTPDGRYRLEGRSKGDTCEEATISIAVRSPRNRVITRQSFAAEEIYGFDRVVTGEDMRRSLIHWVTNGGRSDRTTADLPAWGDARSRGVIIDDGLNEETYAALRGGARPMLCFADTTASQRCLALSANGRRLLQVAEVDNS